MLKEMLKDQMAPIPLPPPGALPAQPVLPIDPRS
jgi:hypothetical protein